MSVSSILAFVLAGAVAKAKSVQVARRSEDRIAELEGERDRQYEANAGLIARIAELEDDVARANVQFRRDQDLIDVWRTRALFAEGRGAQQPAEPDFRPAEMAQALQQQNYQQGLGAMGLLGAQSLIDAELFCNCVPSRSQVWATSDPE